MKKLQMTLTLDFKEEGQQWSGVCRENGTAACGDTVYETILALADLIVLNMKTHADLAETEQKFLERIGMRFLEGKPIHALVEKLALSKA